MLKTGIYLSSHRDMMRRKDEFNVGHPSTYTQASTQNYPAATTFSCASIDMSTDSASLVQ